MPKTAKFAVLIETNKYAGNFEREMCAHLTGHVGECEVGDEFIVPEVAGLFEGVIGNEPDDNGCYRPVALGCDIKGGTNQGVVIYFDGEPTQVHLDTIKERVKSFTYEDKLEIKSIELLEFENKVTKKRL